jgi:hypothetical protein
MSTEKTKSSFFSKLGKMVKDVSYVGVIEGREALATGLYTAAEKVEPNEKQRMKSESIQKEWDSKAKTQAVPA